MNTTTDIKLFKMDNIQLMDGCQDNEFNMGLVDPEYGIGESSKNHNSRNTPVKQKNGTIIKIDNPNYTKKDWDDSTPPYWYFRELFRVTQHHMIFGANYFPEIVGTPFKPPRRADFDQFIKDHPKGWIIWDKLNGENDFNDCELIKTSFNFDSYVLQYMWAGMMQGSRADGTKMEGNKKLNEKRIHPTQKPVRIYEILLSKYVKKNQKVLDTHLGSGSIAIASNRLGINLVACEIDEEIYNKAIERYNQEIKQLSLNFLDSVTPIK